MSTEIFNESLMIDRGFAAYKNYLYVFGRRNQELVKAYWGYDSKEFFNKVVRSGLEFYNLNVKSTYGYRDGRFLKFINMWGNTYIYVEDSHGHKYVIPFDGGDFEMNDKDLVPILREKMPVEGLEELIGRLDNEEDC